MVLTPEAQDSALAINGMAGGLKYLFGDPATVFSTVKVRDLLFDGIPILCAGSESIPAWSLLCAFIKGMYNSGSLPPAIRYDEVSGNFYYSFFYHVSFHQFSKNIF